MRANLSGGVMDGYPVRHVVLGGTSDSSGATRTYMTTGNMLDHRTLRMPDGGPIFEGFFVSSILGNGQIPPLADAPIIQMPTQSELHSTNGFRRPDSDAPDNRFRNYEMSGMSHNDARENPAFTDCTHPELSHYPFGAMTERLSTTPPVKPRRSTRATWLTSPERWYAIAQCESNASS